MFSTFLLKLKVLLSTLSSEQYKERLKEMKMQVLAKMKEDKRFFPGTTASILTNRRDSISSLKRNSDSR